MMPTLDVILTQTKVRAFTQKQADFLAQAANQGGGEHDKSTRPHRAAGRPATSRRTGWHRARCAQTPAFSAARPRVIASTNARDSVPTPQARQEIEVNPLPPGQERSTATSRYPAGSPPRSSCARSST